MNINQTSSQNQSYQIILSQISSDAEYWINLYIIPGIVINGLIGNAMVSLVLCPLVSKRKVPAYLYLKHLALTDMMTCGLMVVYSLRALGKFLNWEWIYTKVFATVFTKVIFVLINYFMKVSIWIVVALCADRYVMICHVFKYGLWCTVTNAKRALYCVYVACALWMIPLYMRYTVDSIPCPGHKVNGNRSRDFDPTKSFISRTDTSMTCYGFSLRTTFDDSYEIYEIFREIAMTYIPLVTLFVIKVRILLVYNKVINMAPRGGNTASMRGRTLMDERQLTFIMVGIMVILLVCLTPTSVGTLIDTIYQHRWRPNHTTFNAVGNLLEISNYSFNFYIYCFGCSIIRNRVWGLLRSIGSLFKFSS